MTTPWAVVDRFEGDFITWLLACYFVFPRLGVAAKHGWLVTESVVWFLSCTYLSMASIRLRKMHNYCKYRSRMKELIALASCLVSWPTSYVVYDVFSGNSYRGLQLG